MKTIAVIAMVALWVLLLWEVGVFALTFEDFRMLSTGYTDGQVMAYVGPSATLYA